MSTVLRVLPLATPIVLLTAVSMLAQTYFAERTSPKDNRVMAENPWYANLPANRWIELEAGPNSPIGFRTDHAGAVYVPERNSVFLFGSDSHLRNFDNGLLELQLDDMRWHLPYVPSPRYAMRTDKQGRRISGVARLLPWPMHIYDAMVYDQRNRELLVLSGAKHSFVAAPGTQADPLWAYSPARDRWRILNTNRNPDPNFFAAGTAYDPIGGTVLAYAGIAADTPFIAPASEDEIGRTGVWQLSSDRKGWIRRADKAQHWGWFNLEYDALNRSLAVFGGKKNDSAVWVYETSQGADGNGDLRTLIPDGDACPGGYYFPASYNSKLGVTLILPPDPPSGISITCVYDRRNNTYTRIPGAELRWLGLNFMLVYASKIDVHILIAGSFSRNERTSVWALKLDRTVLRR